MNSGMRIGDLAKAVGVSTSALRYYEDAGLLGLPERTESGYRLYPPEAVGRIRFVQRAKALGLTLREVRELVSSPSAEIAEERGRLRHMVAHKLAETRKRVADLRALEGELESLYFRLMHAPSPDCAHVGDCACWLPTEEEVKMMKKEVACCGELCCPSCSCSDGEPCNCPDCPCCLDSVAEAGKTAPALAVDVAGRTLRTKGRVPVLAASNR
ncbi:MAG: heavy metal-responsive transcriptional regulator [Candidatus Dormibacteraceae bacterium]